MAAIHAGLQCGGAAVFASAYRAVLGAEGDELAGGRLIRPYAPAATWASARESATGRSRPRFSARRRIPAQARALKKYRCGTAPVSKMSDNEHTPSSLRNRPAKPVHSDVLSVQHSVGEPIPEFDHAPEDGSKVPSSVR